MIAVNIVAMSAMGSYNVFYWIYCPNKVGSTCRMRQLFQRVMTLQIAILLVLSGAMLLVVHFYEMAVFDGLGSTCMVLNVVNFGAPLATLVNRLTLIDVLLEVSIVVRKCVILAATVVRRQLIRLDAVVFLWCPCPRPISHSQ
jgi:hypothetical protein